MYAHVFVNICVEINVYNMSLCWHSIADLTVVILRATGDYLKVVLLYHLFQGVIRY